MERRDTCFFCTSTYQLFSILSLAKMNKEKADLYIDPQFKDADAIASRISELSLFHKVSIINRNRIIEKYFTIRKGLLRRLQKARSYLRVNEIAGTVLGEDVCYNKIYISSRAYFPRMVILYYLRKQVPFEICCLDDGVGSYLGDQAYEPGGTDRIIRKLLFGSAANDTDHVRYLFAPDVFRTVNPDGKQTLRRIDPIWDNSNGLAVLNHIFHADAGCGIKETVVLLEEPGYGLFTAGGTKALKRLFREFRDQFGCEETIIKKHPRSRIPEEKGFRYYDRFDIPLEAVCINSNMLDKVLVSCISTAAVTPKILMGQEPYVILLYRLVDLRNGVSKEMESFFQCVQSSYRQPERFMIPRSIDEFHCAVRSIRRQIRGNRDSS